MDELTTTKDNIGNKLSISMDKTTNEVFSEWLVGELRKRGWTQSDLARAAGISRQVISAYINRQREKPDEDVLILIGQAFHLPPETVFRAAGLLPPSLSNTTAHDEFIYLIEQLSPDEQEEILELLRFKAERKQQINAAKPTTKSSRKKNPARSALIDK